MWYRFFSILLICLGLVLKLHSQTINMENLTIDNGLSNNLPEDIFQDSTGYIWIATESGLNRYDGFNVKQFFSDPADTNSLNHNTVYTICPIDGKRFFFGTYRGVSLYNPVQEIFSNVKFLMDGSEFAPMTITKIIRTQNREFLAACDKGIFIYSEKENAFIPYHLDAKNSSAERDHIIVLFEDKDQNLWIGTYENGLFLYNRKLKTVIGMKYMIGDQDQLEKNKILVISQDKKGSVWIATEKGAFRYNGSPVLKRYTTEDKLPDNFIYTLFCRSNGDVLLAAGPNGISKYDPSSDSFHLLRNSFYSTISGDLVTVMFEDKQGNLWIGAQQSGIFIFKFQEQIFTSIQSQDLRGNPEMNDFILSIIEDHSGKIWIGTNGSGINVVDPKTSVAQNINTKNPNTIQENYIQSILEDHKNNIWIGTYLGGVTKYNETSKTFKTYRNIPGNKNSLINDIVNYVYEDSKRNIWVLTHQGLSRYVEEIDGFINYSVREENPVPINFATCMIEDNDDLWIGTYNGLFRFNRKTETLKTYLGNKSRHEISDDVVYSLLKDRKGRIWVGTFNGLNLYNKKGDNFILFSKANGIPDNLIEGILEDKFGYIWLSTSTGLSRFDSEKKLFLNFSKRDGLMHNVFQHGAFFMTKEGKLFFGSKSGLVIVNPSELKNSAAKPRIVFTEFKLFDNPVFPQEGSLLEKPIDETKKIVLKYNQSFFSFSFSSLNFTSPTHDNFSCYLDGYDYDWRNLGKNNSITYTKIPPGKYTFYAKVINKNSSSEAMKQLTIVVKPPFWKTTWMYSLYLLVIMTVVLLIYNYLITKTEYQRELLIERLEKQKSMEINQSKIKFFMNVSHEFKTPLTLIISPLEKLIQETENSGNERQKHFIHLAYNNAIRLSRLINQIMDIRKIDTGTIRLKAKPTDVVSASKNIFNYFQEEATNHNIQYQFISHIDETTLWLDEEKYEKILFNLLSNAFRHTPNQGSISFTISNSGNNTVCISVRDSGHGIPAEEQNKIFDRFYQVENDITGNPSSSGIGLSIVKEYVDLHHGSVSVASEPDNGAEFSIYFLKGDTHLTAEEKIVAEKIISFAKSEFALFPLISNEESASEERSHNNKQRVLVVEDNFELRNYLLDSLEAEFDVYEASDGEEGLKMVYQILPNLVVSDVMMPRMSGIELCQKIKSDIKTSHIPVILLTVLSSEEDKIGGYESGADGYIVKPFEINVLRSRIMNLMLSRAKLRQKYLTELNPDITTISQNKVDQAFLEKAHKIVMDNLANVDFSAENFASEIGMSRSNLHLKLKALTEQSATEFIRTIRLKEATKQLSSFAYNISEVAYMVGFNNISYFNRCFKKQFGITPTEFLDDLQK